VRLSRPAGAWVAVALALAVLGFAREASASADVCSGGAPYEASGSPSRSGLGGLVAFLGSPRWSKEVLPQWEPTGASTSWANHLAYAWYRDTRLWGTTGTAAWWVTPGVGCGLESEAERKDPYQYGEGPLYPPEVCVIVYVQLALASFDCEDSTQLATSSPPVEVQRGGRRLLSGFAAPGTGSVEVRLQDGSATLPAVGGVYGGSVSAHLGKVLGVTDLTAAAARSPAPVVLVDQTGISTSSDGPLASGPRMKSVAARIHARIPSVAAVDLGDSVIGRRVRDSVLYAPGARPLAVRVAGALHAPAPAALGVGAAKMFVSLARVVVLVGRSD
jgi:hypothetical protein